MSLIQETEALGEKVQGESSEESAATTAPETSVEALAGEDNRTPEEKALTNHLRGARMPIDRDAAHAAETELVNGEVGKLPASLKDSLQLLEETNALIPKTAFESKVKFAKLQKLSAHVHALSQTRPHPIIHAPDFLKRTPDASALAQIAACYPRQKPKKTV